MNPDQLLDGTLDLSVIETGSTAKPLHPVQASQARIEADGKSASGVAVAQPHQGIREVGLTLPCESDCHAHPIAIIERIVEIGGERLKCGQDVAALQALTPRQHPVGFHQYRIVDTESRGLVAVPPFEAVTIALEGLWL